MVHTFVILAFRRTVKIEISLDYVAVSKKKKKTTTL